MTPNEFFEKLATVTEPRPFVAPVDIMIGPADAMAAKLLLWLQEQMPPKATVGDYNDVLDAAKWWTVMFAASDNVKE